MLFQTTIEENKFTASLDHHNIMSPSASIGEPLTTAAEVHAVKCVFNIIHLFLLD